jgi:hypothetical protein
MKAKISHSTEYKTIEVRVKITLFIIREIKGESARNTTERNGP